VPERIPPDTADPENSLVKLRPARLASGGASLGRDAAAAAVARTDGSGGGGGGGGNPSRRSRDAADATGLVLAWSAASPLDSTPRRGFSHLYGVRLQVRPSRPVQVFELACVSVCLGV
jgi:hypothetical protein